jgi:hypothetical protein
MTKAATTEELSTLHKQVAESLVEDLTSAASIEDPALRAAVRKEARAQAIAFLKNNNITAAQGNNELNALQQALTARKAAKAKPVAVPQEALDEAADLFAARNLQ